MGAAAQLHGERAAHLDDADPVAVILAEQGHGAHGAGLVERGLDGVDAVVGVGGLVGDGLDARHLLRGQLLAVLEVEAQVARLVHRTGLRGGGTEDLAQRAVDEVRGRVGLLRLVAPRRIDGDLRQLADGQLAADDAALVQPQLLAHALDVVDLQHRAGGGGDAAVIGHLAAALGVERGTVEDQLDFAALGGALQARAVGDETDDGGLVDELVVAGELGRVLVDELAVDAEVAVGALLGGVVGLGAGALLRHFAVELVAVDDEAGLCGHLHGQVDGETVGVVQGERIGAGQLRRPLRLRLRGDAFEQVGAGLEGLQEGLLLGQRDAQDAVPVVGDLRVRRRHGVADGLHQRLQRLAGRAQQPRRADDAAQQAAQDVAAVRVGRGDAVEHEHQTGAAVVGDDAETDVVDVARLAAGAVGGAGELFGDVDDGAQQVGFVDVLDALQQERDALDAHAGVDVLLRQRAEDLEGVLAGALAALVLHEDEVPDLDVPVLVGLRAALDAVLGAAIVEDLRARAARPGHAHRPVVVGHAAALDALFRDADDVAPDVVRLIVVEVDRDPQQLGIDAVTAVLDRVGQQRPRVLDGAFLEVVAEREVAGHLEEGVVAGGDAHLLDVEGAHALLDGGGGGELRGLVAQEVRLEGDHARVDEQQVRVVEDQRGAGDLGVPRVHEMVDETLPDLMGLHGVGSLFRDVR